MATFGDTSIYTGGGTVNNALHGTKATGPVSGTVDSITVLLNAGQNANVKVKCALYKVSDKSLVAVTEERTLALTTVFQSFTFNFTTPPTVSDIEYYILVFADNGASPFGSYVAITTTAGSYKRCWKTGLTYPTLPEPLVITESNGSASIYCTYSIPSPPSAEPILPRKAAYSGYHCFIEQYQKRRIAGLIPFKLPDGTLYPS